MQRQYFLVVGVLCFTLSCYYVFSQITLFGDLYISPKNELHIGSDKLYFESGKIITDRGLDGGIFSFAKGSLWEGVDHSKHIDGFVRFYDDSEFTHPLGNDNAYHPVHIFNFWEVVIWIWPTNIVFMGY